MYSPDELAVNFLLASPLLACVMLAASQEVAMPTIALSARDGAVPRLLLARFDFEENEAFTSGQARGFHRLLTHAAIDASSPPTAATAPSLPGYPDFGQIDMQRGVGRVTTKTATAVAQADQGWAVRFTIDGASMAYISDPKEISIQAGAQIIARVWTRTQGLKHAQSRLSLRFHDAAGRPIGGIYSSIALRSEGAWRALEIEPPAAPENARSISLWLELVQPSSAKLVEEMRFAAATNDMRGEAFFDDIEVWQMPAVEFSAMGNGLIAPASIAQMSIRCSDPSMSTCNVAVRVRDAGDAVVFTQSFAVPADRAVTLDVPPLATGWYEAEALFSQGKTQIARKLARFAVLPDDPFEPDEPPRFGASLTRADMPVGPALDLARSAFVVLPVWTTATDTRDAKREIDLLRPVVAQLLDRRVEPMFRVCQVPAPLANEQRIDTDDPFALFALEASRWQPALEPWLLAFGQQVDQWFIGNDPVDATRADLHQRIDSVATAMRTAIAGPAVGLPWSPDEELPLELEATITADRHTLELVVDPAWRESAAEIYQGFPSNARGMARIVPLSAGSVDDRERAIDLALRAIDAWRAGLDAVSVEVTAEEGSLIPGPPMELAAWRQISTRLCGRRFIAEIPVQQGVRALLADGARGTVLVMWSEGGDAEVEVAVDLGTTAVACTDLWGRGAIVAPSARGHVFQVARAPTFVEGVSREMCLLRRGFRIDPSFAQSRRAPQEASLVLANPFDVPLSGTLTVIAPDALSISPKSHRFTMPAAGEARMPVMFSVPRALSSGPITVRVEIDASAREPFRAVLDAALEVGFQKATIDASWRLARSIESGAVDLVLMLKVTNVSDAPLDVEAFAVADGFMQNRKPILGLAPSATAVRVFHFADGARLISGRDIRVGVHDTDGDGRLLKRIPIPPLLPPSTTLVEVENGE